ncbi:MAG: hypothetical protein GXO89_01620 [Chlorobi bacterium]|nr:hypothetical protein [Chlorobiota bacterium]
MKIGRFITYSLFLILTLTVLLPKTIKCQDSIASSSEKKNTIKGFVTLAPLLYKNEFSVALGYERKIDSTNSLELTSSFLFLSNEMGDKTKNYALHPYMGL